MNVYFNQCISVADPLLLDVSGSNLSGVGWIQIPVPVRQGRVKLLKSAENCHSLTRVLPQNG
jgi:hypothetical protein